MTDAVTTMLLGMLKHLLLDVMLLLFLTILLVLGMWEWGKRWKHNRGIAVGLTAIGLAFGIPAIWHIKLMNNLIELRNFLWVHRVAMAVLFGALALPLSFVVGRWKRAGGWIMALGFFCWVPLFVQAGMILHSGGDTIEKMALKQTALVIKEAVQKQDIGALLRLLDKLEIPPNPDNFDAIIFPLLLELLHHEDSRVIKLVAENVKNRGDVSGLRPLLEVRMDSPETKTVILTCARKLAKLPGAAEILLDVVLDGKGEARIEALELLSENWQVFLRANMHTIILKGDDELREHISRLIGTGYGGQESLIEPFMQAIISGNPAQRHSALQSLFLLVSNPKVREKIDPAPIARILQSGNAEEQLMAGKILRVLGAEKATGAFINAAGTADMRVVMMALETLLDINAVKDPNLFANHLEHPNPQMRALAYRGLKVSLPRNLSLNDPLIKRIQKSAQKETDPEAKRKVVILIAWLDLENAFEYVDSLVASRVRTTEDMLSAIEAFDLLGDARAVPRLIELCKESNPKVRRASASVLGRLGDKSALNILNSLLNDPDASVRQTAQDAIEEIKSATLPPTTPRWEDAPTTAESHFPSSGVPPDQPPW